MDTHFWKRISRTAFILCLIISVSPSHLSLAGFEVDPSLEDYKTEPAIQGGLRSIGSDTLNNPMTKWGELFRAIYPDAYISIEGRGSGTALPGLIDNRCQLGPMSRLMKPKEIEAFVARYGYEPTPVKVAIDAIGIFVHKDNPLKRISLDELDSIFSSEHRRSGQSIVSWDQLGMGGALWDRKPLRIYSRNSFSGTYSFFQDAALSGGPFSPEIIEEANSSILVNEISKNLYGIGYCGIGYQTSGVKALSLTGPDGKYYAPTAENCLNNTYPLARYLYIYINKSPTKPLDKMTREFLRFALSRKGQEIIAKDGYFPIPSSVAKEEIRKISS
jgi:phosphate transport system substrate-binding protein